MFGAWIVTVPRYVNDELVTQTIHPPSQFPDQARAEQWLFDRRKALGGEYAGGYVVRVGLVATLTASGDMVRTLN